MKTLGTLIAAALLATTALAQHEGHTDTMHKAQTPVKHSQKSHTAMKGQHQTVTVNNGKYSPSTINVKAGKPVHLTFKLGPNPGCGDTLVIKTTGSRRSSPRAKARR